MSQILSEQIPNKEINDNSYNYVHFNSKLETKADFEDPEANDSSLDFTGLTINGESIKLSDFKGKTVVIESGSYTCPSYIGYIDPMNKLAEKYTDVEFIVL